MSINRVSISGNLTRDPELRMTSSGSQVLSFCVAVNDRRRNAQGDWEDVPNYVDCVLFGSRAEALSKFLAKGQKVALEGRLRWSQWERDGQKRSKLEVIADNLDFFSQRRNADTSAPYGGYATQAPAPAPYAQTGYAQGAQAGYAESTPAYVAPAPTQDGFAPSAPDAQPPMADAYTTEIPF